MSAPINYFKLGLFVISAFVLVVFAVVILGSEAFAPKGIMMETYFDESVQGLEIGSPVKRRGVRIGKVEEIDFVSKAYHLGPTDRDFIEFSRYVIVRASLDAEVFGQGESNQRQILLKRMIDQGLRARLTSQGLTGLVYLELDYFDPERNKPPQISWMPDTFYVPSAPSTLTRVTESIDQVFKKMEQTDIAKLAGDMDELVLSMNQTLADSLITSTTQQARLLLEELRETNRKLRNQLNAPGMESFAEDAADATASAKRILEQAEETTPKVLERLDGITEKMSTMTDDLKKTLGNASRISDKVQVASEDFPQVMSEFKQVLRRVDRMLTGEQQSLQAVIENMRVASGNLREMTINARKYPSHMFFGDPPKPSEPGKR